MKNLNLVILLFLYILPFFSFAQGWERSYNNDHNLTTYLASEKTLDGGIIIATAQKDSNSNSQLLFLYQTDASGNVVWEYHDSIHIDSLVLVSEIHSTNDGNYLVSFSSGPELDAPSILMKISPIGNILWEITLPFQILKKVNLIEENSDEEYILAGAIDQLPTTALGVVKLSNNGDLIWEKELPVIGSSLNKYVKDLIVTSNNDIIILRNDNLASVIGTRPVLTKLNNNGDLIWEKSYVNYPSPEYPHSAIELASGDFLILVTSTPDTLSGISSSTSNPSLIKVNADGDQLWYKFYPEGEKKTFYDNSILETNDGGIVLGGTIHYSNNGQSPDFSLQKLDSIGNIEWEKTYGRSKSDWIRRLFLADDQGFYLTGTTRDLNNKSHPYIVKTDSLGNLFSNSLEGILFNDEDLDCMNGSNEDGMKQWLIQATKGNEHYSTLTSESGDYEFNLDTGTYDIAITPISPYWALCDTTFNITFTNFPDTLLQDIPALAEIDCPLLDVSIGTPFIRRCSTSTYYIQYCNYGTATAEDAYIEIMFDPDMTLNSSSIPITTQVGNMFTFDLGDVAYDTCGTFQVEISLGDSTNCDSIILGATHCVEAHIYPDSICLPSGNWSGASIEVDANCTGDSISFFIQNVGTAPTQPNLQYIVVEDDVILFDGNFTLNPMESEIVVVPTNGSTFRLEAEQEPNHPGMSMPSVSVENCGLLNTNLSIGFINIFAQDDGDPFVDIDCQSNIGSYDPNDKQGFPLGYDDENYIDRGQDIDYMIRFQNTGTDTAFNIVVKDQLSEFLDIGTVRPGASSHPYEYSVAGNGLMSFTFNNIMLPDSNVNEPASNGFVKFKVSQKFNLDLETQIHNQAAIYFDFNAPIFTNETLHTIGENFVIVSIDTPSEKSLAQVKVHPNPFSQFVNFDVEGLEIKNGTFKLYDATGRLLRLQNFNNNTFTFQKKDLQAGMYFFTIEEDGKLISNGKLVAQ